MKIIEFVFIIAFLFSCSTSNSQVLNNSAKYNQTVSSKEITLGVKPSFFIPAGKLNEQYTSGPGVSIQGEKKLSDNLSICFSGEYYMFWGKEYTLYGEVTIKDNTFSNLFNISFGPKYYFINKKQKIFAGLESGINHFRYSGSTTRILSTGSEFTGESSSRTLLGINLYLGAEYPVGKNTNLTFQTKYYAFFPHGISREPNNFFGIQIGLSFDLK